MSNRFANALCWLGIFLAGSGMACIIIATRVHATNLDGRYDNAPNKAWYETRVLTPDAEKRFAFHSCCSNSDVFKTKFKVNKVDGSDEWWYLKDNEWHLVPADIIWHEPTPTGEPVLFVYNGRETCFFVPPGDM